MHGILKFGFQNIFMYKYKRLITKAKKKLSYKRGTNALMSGVVLSIYCFKINK